MYKYLLASLIALLGSTGLVSAQVGLGTPTAPEGSFEPSYGPYAPAVYPAYPTESKPKPNHPILGHFARTMFTPIRVAAGHLLPPRCETPTKEEVGRMIADGGYSPAQITAAKIKIEDAQANARRAAVKYLATVDCNYYPEAETGLIAALRADRAESVRYEAALALGTCGGLTARMLEALNMTALGVELDGNPAESSEKVRGAARGSLNRCLCRGLCLPPMDQQQMLPPVDWGAPDPTIQPTGYYLAVYAPPVATSITQQERARAESVSVNPTQAVPAPRGWSLYQVLQNITSGRDSTRDTRKDGDPRLRGLSPLGSDTILSIPTSPPFTMPTRYNDDE